MKDLFRNARILSLIVLVLAFFGCEDDDEGTTLPAVTAGFTFEAIPSTGTVSFINISENADTFEWDFGNGTTSTEINPTVTFASGTYTVSLTATNVAGASDTFEDQLVVVVPQAIMVPITFDDANTDYDVGTFGGASFEIVANPAPGGSNDVASQVGAITNVGAEFEGIFFDLGEALDLTTEKTVTMNFWSESAIDVLLKLEEGTGAATEVTASHSGSGWEMLSFDFTSSDSFSRLTLFVDGPGTTAGTFYIDDVEQAETMVPGFDSGLLTNGDFENGADPWIGNGANVVAESGNSFNQVDVTAAGNPFDVNLSQVVEITQGTNYLLTFDASSDRERTMLAGIGLNEAPFTNTAPSVNLTTETQTFTLQLSAADFGGANSRVLFDMGAEVGVVVIDNVSLVEGGDGSDSNGGGGNGDESPFCRTQIQAFAGDAGSDIFLSVFNVDSETMRIEIESADADPVDLLVLPAGLWNPIPGISSAPAEVSPGVWAGEFFFPGGAPENVEFFIEWSKVSFAGNWRSSAPDTLDTVPFNATCDTSSGGGNGGCTGSAVAATTLPLDFEGCESFVSSFSSIGDGGVVPSLDANPSKSGINTSDNVLKVVRASGINRWGGIQNSFPQGVIDITTQVFKIKVYSSVPDVTYRFELALDPQTDPVTGNPPPVFRQVSGGANTWTEIEFTFTGLPASPTTYNQLVIKPDNPDGSDGEVTTEERVFYFDDLRLE